MAQTEAERLRRIARELAAEADTTDPAAQERVEAYERLAAAAEGAEVPTESGEDDTEASS